MLKQQTTTIKNTKTAPIVTNNFPKNNSPAWRNYKPTVPGNAAVTQLDTGKK